MHRCTWDILFWYMCLYKDFLNGMHQFCILLHMFFQSHFWGGEMKDCIKIHRNWNMQGPKDQIQDEKIQNRSNSHVLNASDCQRLRLASLCRGLSFHIFHGSRFVNTLQQWKKKYQFVGDFEVGRMEAGKLLEQFSDVWHETFWVLWANLACRSVFFS